MQPKIAQISAAEQHWITAQLASAQKFVAAFAPQHEEQPITLAVLDNAFATWLTTETTESKVINGVINCVGVSFGQALVDGVGLSWVIATDKSGSDLAVHGLPGQGDILVYPANFVAKRWERRETNFLSAAYQQIAQQTQTVAQPGSHHSGIKPWWKFW